MTMIYNIITTISFLLFSLFPNKTKVSSSEHSTKTNVTVDAKFAFEEKATSIYGALNCGPFSRPSFEGFEEALKGFYLLKEKGLVQKEVLTLVDFSLSSNVKRLWVIDLESNTILYQSLVAHGMNTGEEFANSFSNATSSFKSSLGLYVTGETYIGKHGMSLKLDGLEKGINDNARERGVVMHAADYVSNSFIKNNKRLGRSQGCPAIPEEMLGSIVNTIKNKSCLFIYHPSRSFSTVFESAS